MGGCDGMLRVCWSTLRGWHRRIPLFPLLMAYLRLFALSAIVSFGLAWAWVIMMPMAFMDPEYPSWRAKQLMLKQCDLGDGIILGDSRAAVDIAPKRLPMRATNLAVG